MNYSPIFKTAGVAKNIWRKINTIASILCKIRQIFVLGHYLFLKAYRFPQTMLLEQVMSVDKYPNIFSCQMEAIVTKYQKIKLLLYYYALLLSFIGCRSCDPK